MCFESIDEAVMRASNATSFSRKGIRFSPISVSWDRDTEEKGSFL